MRELLGQTAHSAGTFGDLPPYGQVTMFFALQHDLVSAWPVEVTG
ncbi:hypothetical protein [uncultured Jatrophihabitans sp.]